MVGDEVEEDVLLDGDGDGELADSVVRVMVAPESACEPPSGLMPVTMASSSVEPFTVTWKPLLVSTLLALDSVMCSTLGTLTCCLPRDTQMVTDVPSSTVLPEPGSIRREAELSQPVDRNRIFAMTVHDGREIVSHTVPFANIAGGETFILIRSRFTIESGRRRDRIRPERFER